MKLLLPAGLKMEMVNKIFLNGWTLLMDKNIILLTTRHLPLTRTSVLSLHLNVTVINNFLISKNIYKFNFIFSALFFYRANILTIQKSLLSQSVLYLQ